MGISGHEENEDISNFIDLINHAFYDKETNL